MASRGKYSAIVLDIDGTMVGPDRVIPERLKVAAMAAERAGAVVLIATGRMLSSTLHFARELGTKSPIICYQGALTVDSDRKTVLRHVRLDRDIANLAIETIQPIRGSRQRLCRRRGLHRAVIAVVGRLRRTNESGAHCCR